MTPEQQAQVEQWRHNLIAAQNTGSYTEMSILIIRLDTLDQLGLL